jgi:hypothetical protein
MACKRASSYRASRPSTTPTAKDWHIDVISTSPLGATNQELKNRNALGHRPAPSAQDPRNVTLVSAAWAETHKRVKYGNLCAAAGTTFHSFALETTGGHGMQSTTSSSSIYATRVCRLALSQCWCHVRHGRSRSRSPWQRCWMQLRLGPRLRLPRSFFASALPLLQGNTMILRLLARKFDICLAFGYGIRQRLYRIPLRPRPSRAVVRFSDASLDHAAL